MNKKQKKERSGRILDFSALCVCAVIIVILCAAGCLGDEDYYPGTDTGSGGDDDDDTGDTEVHDMSSSEGAPQVTSEHQGWQQAICTQSEDCHQQYEDQVEVTSECAACHGVNGAKNHCAETANCFLCHDARGDIPHSEETGTTDSDCLTCHLD